MNHVDDFLKQSLECSIYLNPRDHGLTYEEIHEVGSRSGLMRGEIDDAIRHFPSHFGQSRRQLSDGHGLADFFRENIPEYRNPHAFEFVVTSLRDLGRSAGRESARIPRDVLVASATAKQLLDRDVEVAIAIYLIAERLVEKDGYLSFARGREDYALPSEQIRNWGAIPAHRRSDLAKTYELVKDVTQRRTDGRPQSAEPLKAFEQQLESLGHGRFRIWWARACSELTCTNPATSPLTVCVLAAALAEGAITFIVGRARKLGLATLNSKTFQESPTRWKFDDLLSSAAAGGADAIFDPKIRDRADRLNAIRQRIHAGRLMAEQPGGPIPDTRPEEAREAIETLDIVVRSILDWLARHPSEASSAL